MAECIACYVEQRGNEWEGVCIDFDLAVQGHSFEEVRVKLGRAIQEYVGYVRSLPESEQEQFWNRRVPLSTRVLFVLRVLKTYLSAPRHHGDDHFHGYGSYTLPCPA